MVEYPDFVPADKIAADVVQSYGELVGRVNNMKSAMAKFHNELRNYNAKLEGQVRGTGIDVNTAPASPMAQRIRLRDSLSRHLKNAQIEVGSGKIHDFLQDLDRLVQQILSVKKFKDEVELLANITGVHRKISDDLADLLGRLASVYGSLGEIRKSI